MPKVHEGPRMGLSKNPGRRRIFRRRVSSSKIHLARSFPHTELSRASSALQDSNRPSDVGWFDSTSALDSDEEFYSVYDDGLSLNGSEIAPRPSDSSPKVVHFTDQQPKLRVRPHSQNYNRSNSLLKIAISNDSTSKSDGPRAGVGSVLAGELSTSQVGDHCGLLPKTCMPCISSNSLFEKRRSSSPDTPSSRRKSFSRLSFKLREGYADMTLFSPMALKQKPLAGSMVPFCTKEKQMRGSWSPIEPSSFKLHAITVAGDVPSILIINLQIPLYPATIFQGENDGKGMNVVLYFKVSERYSKDLPDQFRENISKLLNDEVERVKGFPLDTITPFRERLKILGRVGNVENLSLSAAEKKLMNAYNEKPVLSRPQHEFFLGENYMEIDLDVHRFSYIARKGVEGFIERLKQSILEFGLTIQGNKVEDLPEHILCAIQLNKIDYNNHSQLGF